jgi:hypothetical protein
MMNPVDWPGAGLQISETQNHANKPNLLLLESFSHAYSLKRLSIFSQMQWARFRLSVRLHGKHQFLIDSSDTRPELLQNLL